MESDRPVPTKAEEIKVFLFITAVLAPVLAVGFIAAYGFIVWFYQLLTGHLPGAA
ncbi:periplasmic nitrate reductase subunit NapE [Pseudoduganella flava]|uniref:Nitrate reductase n=1 Tax=Pseudoduganella flava TaxID=871742 RepID=A0A562PP28_9BURK|nr:periplasmic nitrate reductase, NapE protein [Pseudoduganella flava]QGZ40665.1 nitrate reductase [Pseudoduganella flava]TWI46118.1 periplasmic nitrate reductase subunit NapE [Pseudoduganella flava]